MSDEMTKLRDETVNSIITRTKQQGSAMVMVGYTTPEGWPFAVVVAVGKPGNERVMDYLAEFAEKMNIAAPAVPWNGNPGAKA